MKKLMVEENMHLVKMSSKSGQSYINGLTIEHLKRRMKNAKDKGGQGGSSIDLLCLKLSQK